MIEKTFFLQRILVVCFTLIFGLVSCNQNGRVELILPGSYQFEEYIPAIYQKKVGLVVNYASVVGSTHLIDTLLKQDISVIKVFSPEHGFSGKYDAGAGIETDSNYNHTEIEYVSLYGANNKPSSRDLQEIDILIFDLQDVGTRFFTYISTLHYAMEACAENNIPLVVMDRPNPNGHYVDGPVLEPAFQSFVGMHPVPIVYGMTIGEYARMINGEYWLSDSLHCELSVVNCQNYNHSSRYKLPLPPSPNLTNMGSVYLYPSTCLFEGTVVSEGRGTDAPFQIIGHPNYSVGSYVFTPRSIPGASLNPKLRGERCYGMDLRDIPMDSLSMMGSINLRYLISFYKNLQLGEEFFIDYFDLLAGTGDLRKQVLKGYSEEQIKATWKNGLQEFKKIRAKYLLYPDF